MTRTLVPALLPGLSHGDDSLRPPKGAACLARNQNERATKTNHT